MTVIIITIITQGARVPADLRGELKGSLFVRSGILQAIGVISFGNESKVFLRTNSNTDELQHLSAVGIRNPSHFNLLMNVSDHNSLLIYGSLKKPTIDRFSQVTHYSTFISMLACMAVALSGFLFFGDKTLGNVLVCASSMYSTTCTTNFKENNFPTNNVMVNIARL